MTNWTNEELTRIGEAEELRIGSRSSGRAYAPTSATARGTSSSLATGIGQEDAIGQPSIVSGDTSTGGRGVLFGTDPLFRQHPKKLFGQMAQALYWAAGPDPLTRIP